MSHKPIISWEEDSLGGLHMGRLSPSSRVYVLLIAGISVLAALNAFLPQGSFIEGAELPASRGVIAVASAGLSLVIYGGLGLVGRRLARRLGYPDLWDARVTWRERLVTPALWGIGLGLFFIASDAIAGRFHALGPLPHPPFLTSIVASLSAAVGEEIVFRLFFISLWVWLVSDRLLGGRAERRVFGVASWASALAFALGHIPSVMIVLGLPRLGDLPAALLLEILVLNGALSLVAAHLFRKSGLVAAMSVHLWADVVWHVLWGLTSG